MFINSDHKILAQEEIIEKLRLEIVWLTKERDSLLLWNTELMRWKSEINNIKESKEKELYTIESILEETKKALDKNSVHFYKITDKQKEKLQELNTAIQERLDELSIQEGKELIDIDSENQKIKKELTKAKKELKAMIDDIQSLKDERIAFEKEKNDIMAALDQERNRCIDYMNNLVIRERDVEILEKRFSKNN